VVMSGDVEARVGNRVDIDELKIRKLLLPYDGAVFKIFSEQEVVLRDGIRDSIHDNRSVYDCTFGGAGGIRTGKRRNWIDPIYLKILYVARSNLILLDVVPIIVLVTVHAVPLGRSRRCLS